MGLVAGADRDRHARPRQPRDSGEEQVPALRLPVPAEMEQDRGVGGKAERGARGLAFLGPRWGETARVDRVREQHELRARSSPAPGRVEDPGADADDPLDAAAEDGVLHDVPRDDRVPVHGAAVQVPEHRSTAGG
jgi:hypothetical protein